MLGRLRSTTMEWMLRQKLDIYKYFLKLQRQKNSQDGHETEFLLK